MSDTPEYLITEEVAELIRTPVATIHAWRVKKKGPPARRVGKRLLYKRDDVIAWVESHGVT